MLLSDKEEKEVKSHFKKVDKRIMDYATNVALEDSKYIFYSKGKKRAYCTHCHHEFTITEKIKHNATGMCPKCKSSCEYKSKGYGRKHLQDYAAFLWFDKSPVNKDIITACWIDCSRDYSETYREVKTNIERITFYIFEMGNPRMYKVAWFNGRLEKTSTVHEIQHGSTHHVRSMESLKGAAVGTPYAYSGWEHYHPHDVIKYLELYSHHPNIEALTKAGLTNIARVKMYGDKTYRAVNWKARKLHHFFKVSKNDFKEMMRVSEKHEDHSYINSYSIRGSSALFTLSVWQKIRRENIKIKYENFLQGAALFQLLLYWDRFEVIAEYSSIPKIFSYASKQYERFNQRDIYMNKASVLVTWKDYISDCINLEMDVTKDAVLYPKNVYEAHQKTLRLVKVKKSEIADRKIKKRHEELEKLTFRSINLVIRPPQNFNEIVKEGEKLKHCVAQYADRHADNETTLLLIRRKNRPNTPFYTVELNKGRVQQVRGHDNKNPTKEVEHFMNAFENQKPKNKKARDVV